MTSEAVEPSAEPPSEPPVPARVPEREPVVLDVGPPREETPDTLVEAAEAERTRRREAGRPIAVITDENLDEYAVGELTFSDEPVVARGDDPGSGAAAGEEEAALAEELARDEAYWRARVLDVRLRWREASDEIGALESEVAGLRRRFYSADDPYRRDAEIKPELDRTIDRLAEVRLEVEEARADLQSVLEEGRRAGALPGWLREGLELEPGPEEGPARDPARGAEPREPRVIEEGGG